MIINDILDFSKIEAGQLELEQQPFCVRDCVEGSLDLVAAQAGGKGLDLAYSLEDGVPPVLVGDVTRLRQVLVNLLSNAVKFTEHGEVVVTVTAQVHGTDAALVLRRPRHRHRHPGRPAGPAVPLLQPGRRLDHPAVRRHRAGAGHQPAAGRGDGRRRSPSRARPGRARPSPCASQLPRGAQTEDALLQPPAELPGRRALVVDDNATNRRILRRQLEGWGMQVEEHASPAAALAAVDAGGALRRRAARHAHAGDGRPAARRGAARAAATRDLPMLLLTSLGQRPPEAAELGLLHLTKPVKAGALRTAVATALGASLAPAAGAAGPAPSRRLRVLLAEDNVVNQRVAVLLLERLGHRADVVGNGEEALVALAARPYDVVLMDVQMPVMDGLEATRRLRQRLPADRQPRIVAMTANALAEDRDCAWRPAWTTTWPSRCGASSSPRRWAGAARPGGRARARRRGAGRRPPSTRASCSR